MLVGRHGAVYIAAASRAALILRSALSSTYQTCARLSRRRFFLVESDDCRLYLTRGGVGGREVVIEGGFIRIELERMHVELVAENRETSRAADSEVEE